MTDDDQFKSWQEQAFDTVLALSSALSFCGSLFACACYVAFRHKRTFGLQLVFFLSLNDAGSQIWVALQFIRSSMSDSWLRHVLCIAQGNFMTYFLLSCILWSSAITYTLFATILRGHQLHKVARRLPYMALMCQGVPFVSCVVGQRSNAYGDSILWCWIKSKPASNRILQFATFYIPCWLCIAFHLYVYFSVRLRLRALFSKSSHWAHTAPGACQAAPSLSTLEHSNSRWISQTDFENDSNIFGSTTHEVEEGSYVELVDTPQSPQHTVPGAEGPGPGCSASSESSTTASQRDKLNKLRKLSGRLMVYPMILVLCWVWGSVNRVYGFFNSGESLFWLSFLHILFVCLQGLLNSIAYGLTEGIGSEISARLRRRQLRQQ